MKNAATLSPTAPADADPGGQVFRLLYCSRISRHRSAAELSLDIDAILNGSRRDNATAGITGVLITDGKMYAQVIEGPAQAVKNLVGHIACDGRHRGVSVISHTASERRLFQEWSMAFIATDRVLEQDTTLFPASDEQHDILAISSFCASLRRHLIDAGVR